MRRLAAFSALLIALATITAAQARLRNEDERDERLAMYLRIGRYADARRLIDEMLRTKPRGDLKNVRAVFGNGPNMRVRRGSAEFACEVRDNGVLLPVTVDGTRVTWLVDTASSRSYVELNASGTSDNA
jgi:hypothetical protein